MGCFQSNVTVSDPVMPEKESDQSNEKKYTRLHALGAAILIQNWYRLCRARLEARRRCAWMIYQSLEYAGEQDHLKLYNLFNDLIVNAHHLDLTVDEKVEDRRQSAENLGLHEEGVWYAENFPPLPDDYQGPVLTFPLDVQQLLHLMQQFGDNKRLHCSQVFQILDEAKRILASRPNIQRASTSISQHITVVGDLHGQYADLQTIFHKNGVPDVTNPYIFNGDFVDRSPNSIETFLILLGLMLIRPSAVFLNRGNHEDHLVNCQYGFLKEIHKKYKAVAGKLTYCFTQLYRFLPLATIIDDSIFICHGGISPRTTLHHLQQLDRTAFITLMKPIENCNSELSDRREIRNLLWSDPIPDDGFGFNKRRGMGCCFGPDVTTDFLNANGFKLLIRSHECKIDGFEWAHDRKLLTIFSASNYYAEGSNNAAYVKIDAKGDVLPVQFSVAGGRMMKNLRQRVRSSEESALTDLKSKIAAHSIELSDAFHQIDPDNTGHITIAQWAEIMETCLDLKLPWRTLQSRLTLSSNVDNMILYETTFQKINVSGSMESLSPSVTEELYKQKNILESVFRAMDKDNSGHISLEEFKATCHRLPSSCNMDEKSMTDLARSIDLNKDGRIDFNEFLEAFRLAESDIKCDL